LVSNDVFPLSEAISRAKTEFVDIIQGSSGKIQEFQ
jgi:hypothetical protein